MTFINGLIALAGAISFLISKKDLKKILLFLVAFSVGSLLGGALFHFIPESLSQLSFIKTLLLTISGFLLFLLIEKLVHWHHCSKEHPQEHKTFTSMILFGDGIHNFIDGLIIASSFIISIPFGIITSLLIMAHELPQEISDFGVLVYGGLEKKKALTYNFLAQLTAVLGGIIGYFFLGVNEYSIFLLPIAAGGFIYIAVNDLIPEVFKEKNTRILISNLIAIILGLLVLISVKLLVG